MSAKAPTESQPSSRPCAKRSGIDEAGRLCGAGALSAGPIVRFSMDTAGGRRYPSAAVTGWKTAGEGGSIVADFTVRNALELAVGTEQNGAKFYAKMAKKFSDQGDVAEVFTRLARDEVDHEAQFKALLDQHEEPGTGAVTAGSEFLRATTISSFFQQDAFHDVDAIRTPQDALENAFSLEKATLLFYEALLDTLGDDASLSAIIQAEKEHVVALMKVILTGAKFRGLGDKW